jgi:hypothetical protein
MSYGAIRGDKRAIAWIDVPSSIFRYPIKSISICPCDFELSCITYIHPFNITISIPKYKML